MKEDLRAIKEITPLWFVLVPFLFLGRLVFGIPWRRSVGDYDFFL